MGGGGLLAPASEGQLRAMRAAYGQVGWRPSDVEYIECHATGTPVGDAVELASLRELWRGESGRCALGAYFGTSGTIVPQSTNSKLVSARKFDSVVCRSA